MRFAVEVEVEEGLAVEVEVETEVGVEVEVDIEADFRESQRKRKGPTGSQRKPKEAKGRYASSALAN